MRPELQTRDNQYKYGHMASQRRMGNVPVLFMNY